MNEGLARAAAGEELRVDSSAIEKSLAALWRSEGASDEHAVIRAALWNVVAHTWNSPDRARASEVLAKVSETLPQRTIVVQADPDGADEISSWISANCHLIGGEKQVCSEEISIVAGGHRVAHVPPLVSALLTPDMPVAVWWMGDLPDQRHGYVEALLRPADRLIVNSCRFSGAGDMEYVRGLTERTTTSPADLSWVMIEDWRAATAVLFDPPSMRERLRKLARIRVGAVGTGEGAFGESAQSLLYAAWLGVLTAGGELDYVFDLRQGIGEAGSLSEVHLEFSDHSEALIVRESGGTVLSTSVDGMTQTVDAVTRTLSRGTPDLIVRQLRRPEADRVYLQVLPAAIELARRVA